MQIADIDQELAIAVLTSEMREKQLSPGNRFFLIGQHALLTYLWESKSLVLPNMPESENSGNRDRGGYLFIF